MNFMSRDYQEPDNYEGKPYVENKDSESDTDL